MLTPFEAAPAFVPDPEYRALWEASVESGRRLARDCGINVLAIARNCMPHLQNTMECVERVAAKFSFWNLVVYENDSDDGTPDALRAWQRKLSLQGRCRIETATNKRENFRGFEPERTAALAEYRNWCLDALRELPHLGAYTMVVDLDPHGGFEPDGVLSSLHYLVTTDYAGMASYSIFRRTHEDGTVGWAHYDCWAMRPCCWWRDRKHEIGFNWASGFLPPVGAPPQSVNSAFGGLALYETDAILSGRYAGGDCEHVALHRAMAAHGHRMALNPGSIYCAILG